MKRFVLTFALALCALSAWSQTIEYKGETVQLGPKAFYVDGSLSDADAAKSPYIFNIKTYHAKVQKYLKKISTIYTNAHDENELKHPD